MAMVRFATTCDSCGIRSTEYTAFPSCRECGGHFCELCAEPGTLRETDGERPETVECPNCAYYLRLPPDALYDESERDDAYERAAARARNNDFADTDGKDWT